MRFFLICFFILLFKNEANSIGYVDNPKSLCINLFQSEVDLDKISRVGQIHTDTDTDTENSQKAFVIEQVYKDLIIQRIKDKTPIIFSERVRKEIDTIYTNQVNNKLLNDLSSLIQEKAAFVELSNPSMCGRDVNCIVHYRTVFKGKNIFLLFRRKWINQKTTYTLIHMEKCHNRSNISLKIKKIKINEDFNYIPPTSIYKEDYNNTHIPKHITASLESLSSFPIQKGMQQYILFEPEGGKEPFLVLVQSTMNTNTYIITNIVHAKPYYLSWSIHDKLIQKHNGISYYELDQAFNYWFKNNTKIISDAKTTDAFFSYNNSIGKVYAFIAKLYESSGNKYILVYFCFPNQLTTPMIVTAYEPHQDKIERLLEVYFKYGEPFLNDILY